MPSLPPWAVGMPSMFHTEEQEVTRKAKIDFSIFGKEIGTKLQKINESVVFMDETISAIASAMVMKKNIILYGPKGHAKTQIATAIAEAFYKPEEIYSRQLGSGTKYDDLFGPYDIPLMREKGQKVVDLSQGMVLKKVAVLDEGFTAPRHLLTEMLQLLSDKRFCQGAALCAKSTLEIVIVCTNVNPKDWVSSAMQDSDKATYEAFVDRFPFQQKVHWPNYTGAAYSAMFEKKYGKAGKYFADVIGEAANMGAPISPRTANIAFETFEKLGLQGIQSIADIPDEEKEKIKRAEQNRVAIEKIDEVRKKAHDILLTQIPGLSKVSSWMSRGVVKVALEGQVDHEFNQLKRKAKSLESYVAAHRTLAGIEDEAKQLRAPAEGESVVRLQETIEIITEGCQALNKIIAAHVISTHPATPQMAGSGTAAPSAGALPEED